MDVDDESRPKKAVDVKTIEEIAGVVPAPTIDGLYAAMQPKSAGAVYDAVASAVQDMTADGWSATQVVGQLYEKVLYDETVPNRQKNKIVMVFSECDKRLVDGADEHLVVLDLALRVAGILSEGQ